MFDPTQLHLEVRDNARFFNWRDRQNYGWTDPDGTGHRWVRFHYDRLENEQLCSWHKCGFPATWQRTTAEHPNNLYEELLCSSHAEVTALAVGEVEIWLVSYADEEWFTYNFQMKLAPGTYEMEY